MNNDFYGCFEYVIPAVLYMHIAYVIGYKILLLCATCFMNFLKGKKGSQPTGAFSDVLETV